MSVESYEKLGLPVVWSDLEVILDPVGKIRI
jgi:hypothetical protein